MAAQAKSARASASRTTTSTRAQKAKGTAQQKTQGTAQKNRKNTTTKTTKTSRAASASTGRSGQTAAKSGSSLTDKQRIEFYNEMIRIRRFEERTARAYTQALIGGYCHLNLGEEAAIVGLLTALTDKDYLFTNYREHGYAITRGIDPNRVMAELYGRTEGTSKGWGGSMHMFDVEARMLGGYGIVGGQLPLATGAGLAIDYRGGDEVVMVTMGDGTTNIGAFHESLNIAALWNLPVVYVVINNKLGMGTTVDKSSAEPELHKRACSYRMESAVVDGLDPEAVYEAAKTAVEAARSGKPYLLEVVTERLKGHSVVDPAKYRSADEVAELKQNDPVVNYGVQLLESGVLDEKTKKKIDDDAQAMASAAADYAEKSDFPEVGTLFDYTYATPVPNDSRRLPGEPLFEPAPIPTGAAK